MSHTLSRLAFVVYPLNRCVCQYGMCGRGCILINPCAGVEICQNGGQCIENCDEVSEYYCNCSLGWTGKNCTDPVSKHHFISFLFCFKGKFCWTFTFGQCSTLMLNELLMARFDGVTLI